MKCRNHVVTNFVTLTAILLIVTNCAKTTETKAAPQNLDNKTTSFIYNMIPESATAKTSPAYSSAVNTFAVHLLTEVEKAAEYTDSNIVLSPFSVSRNVSVLTEAAGGNTKQQLLDALGGQAALDDATDALSELLYADNSVTLQCADALWFDSAKYSLQPAFKTLVESKYGVHVEGLDFTEKSSTVSYVNNWISHNTNKKITAFLKEDEMSDTLVALLANAIYFEANWTSPFDISNTEKAPFTTPSGVQNVDMMSSGYSFSVSETETYQNAKLYYGDDGADYFYLDLYKPTTTIAEFLDRECQTALAEPESGFYGDVSLPKFFFETEVELKPMLQNLGIIDLFDSELSSLPSIFEVPATNPPTNFFVEFVKHKAGIKTDEEGTEAYAVTVTGIADVTSSAPAEPLVFDSPFIYFIRAGKNGLILFAGVVTNPNQ